MSSNPLTPSFRKLHVIPPDAAHDTVRKAIRDNDKSITDINQAIVALKSQITSSPSVVPASTQTVITQSVQVNNWIGLGTVNDQSGVTSYTTLQSDDGALIIFSDASPVAVNLSASVAAPWFCFVQNWGAGVVTFTPNSGTINYIGNLAAATMPLNQGYSCLIVFDGTDFWAETLPIVPLAFTAISHEWLNSYDATTGVFTSAQPDYSDLTGTPTLPATKTPVAGEYLTGYDATTGTFSQSTPAGISVTITTAALTPTGAQGSMTFVDGILTAQVQAT